MVSRLLFVAALASALLLTACAPPTPAPSEVATEPSPSASESVAPAPAALVVSLDGVTVVNDDESVAAEAAFSDGAGVLALLTELFGAVEGVANTAGYPITSYEWPGLNLNVIDGGWASIWLGAAELDSLALRTTDGISVGSPRSAVVAVPVFDSGYDMDGDGASDYLGVEAVVNPDQQSLESPGQPGTDFVAVNFAGDTVTSISSPSSDYGDL